MSRFESVAVTKAANIYNDGNVTSRTIEFSDGSVKTLGIMLPGDYTFSTDRAELMEISSGQLMYKLADSENWISVKGGDEFQVPADSSFDLKVRDVTDYVCSYFDARSS